MNKSVLLAALLPLSAHAGQSTIELFGGEFDTTCLSGCAAEFVSDDNTLGVIATVSGGDALRVGGELILADKGATGVGVNLAADLGPFALTGSYGLYTEQMEYRFSGVSYPARDKPSSNYLRAEIAHSSGLFVGYMAWDAEASFGARRFDGVVDGRAVYTTVSASSSHERELVFAGYRFVFDF